MRNTSKRPIELAALGAFPALALIATAMPGAAQAQVRGRLPTVISPEQQAPVLRRRVPVQTACPDPVEARRAGRPVPAGCPGAQEEQAPVAVEYREQSGETREARPVTDRRIRTTTDTPLSDQPVDDGRLRRRIPGARVPDDGAVQEATPDRPAPVRRRNDYVLGTPGEIAPPREVTPDRPPPIRRRDDYVARTPDEVPDEVTPVRPNPVRFRENTVITTPDEAAPRRVRPVREGPVAADPVRSVRPIRPVIGGDLPPSIAGRIGGQLDCVVPRADMTLATNLPITMTMLCGFPGKGKLMTLRFKPEQWRVVSGAYSANHAARVTFGDPVNGVHPVLSVDEGRHARVTAACVPVYAAYNASNSLTVGPKGAATKPYRIWCTADGKEVRPVDMFWMAGSMATELFEAVVEDGPIEISYFDIATPAILDTVRPVGAYPMLGTDWSQITAIADSAKVNGQTWYPGGYQLTYAKPPLTGRLMRCVDAGGDIAASRCRGYRRTDSGATWTAYSAWASPAMRSAAQRPATAKQTKEVYYTLMPGIIPVLHRAEAGGACRVIIAIEVDIKQIPAGIGQGYADGQRPQKPAPGTVTGVASEPPPVVQPKPDDCI